MNRTERSQHRTMTWVATLKAEFNSAQLRWRQNTPNAPAGKQEGAYAGPWGADPHSLEQYLTMARTLFATCTDPSRPQEVWNKIRAARTLVKARSGLKNGRSEKTLKAYRKLVAFDRREGYWLPDAFAKARVFYRQVAAHEAVLELELERRLTRWSRIERQGKPHHLVWRLASILQTSERLEELRDLFPRDHRAGPPSKLRAGEQAKMPFFRERAAKFGLHPRPAGRPGPASKGKDLPSFPVNFVQRMLQSVKKAEREWEFTQGMSIALHLSAPLRPKEHVIGVVFDGEKYGMLNFTAPTAKDRSGHPTRPILIPAPSPIGQYFREKIDDGTLKPGQRIRVSDRSNFSNAIAARAREVLGKDGPRVSANTIRHALIKYKKRAIRAVAEPILKAARAGQPLEREEVLRADAERQRLQVQLAKSAGHASTRATGRYGGRGGQGIEPTALPADSGKPVKLHGRTLVQLVDTVQAAPDAQRKVKSTPKQES